MNATKVNAGPAESNGRLLLGIWPDSLHVTCGLTACTPGSAPGPTLGNEYGNTLPFLASHNPWSADQVAFRVLPASKGFATNQDCYNTRTVVIISLFVYQVENSILPTVHNGRNCCVRPRFNASHSLFSHASTVHAHSKSAIEKLAAVHKLLLEESGTYSVHHAICRRIRPGVAA